MWARHIEVVLALWLGFSWLIFRYTFDLAQMKMNDIICMVLIIVFSLITYKKRFRYCHLLNFLIGLWLIAWVFSRETGIIFGPYQNYMTVGLLLLMLSLVPSRTKEPPLAWTKYLLKMKKK